MIKFIYSCIGFVSSAKASFCTDSSQIYATAVVVTENIKMAVLVKILQCRRTKFQKKKKSMKICANIITTNREETIT